MTGRNDLTADEDLDLRRDALAYALARLPDTSREVGIYGFETCQVCGEIGTFYNFMGAMMHHGIWTRRDDAWRPSRGLFIAPDHGHRKMEPEEFTSSFCEICRLPTPRDRPHRVSHHVVCDRCQRPWASICPRTCGALPSHSSSGSGGGTTASSRRTGSGLKATSSRTSRSPIHPEASRWVRKSRAAEVVQRRRFLPGSTARRAARLLRRPDGPRAFHRWLQRRLRTSASSRP